MPEALLAQRNCALRCDLQFPSGVIFRSSGLGIDDQQRLRPSPILPGYYLHSVFNSIRVLKIKLYLPFRRQI
jgi:hypothetical protein